MNTLTIQHFAELTGLSVHTLRYYEKIGLLRHIERDASGYRIYAEKDVEWVRFLLRLRETGMPFADMIRFSDLRSQGASTMSARLEILERHRQNVENQLLLMESHLEKIREKIGTYRTDMNISPE